MMDSREHKKSHLSTPSWSEQDRLEELALPDPKLILEKFWHERIRKYNEESVNNFKMFLQNQLCQKDEDHKKQIDILFSDAINKRIDFDTFCKFLISLGAEKCIQSMNHAERLIPVHEAKIQDLAHPLQREDVHAIKQYMEEKKMSASISLRTDSGELTSIESSEHKEQNRYAMHSIGKVFTGMLVILLTRNGILKESDLNKPIQLDELVLAQLPPQVQERLKHVTLHQIMTHQAGLGDYLENYQKCISSGSFPVIKQPEDFLQFVDSGNLKYSNTGILLVGLAVKYAYEKHVGHSCNYNDILEEFILSPAGITSFSHKSSKDCKVNPEDPTALQIVGSPAGGYWITAKDLAKFGCWIYEICKSDPKIHTLIKKYGQEFYPDPERDLIAHGGNIFSSSAYFFVSLKTGACSAILSDQAGTAFTLHGKMQQRTFGVPSLDITDSEIADSLFGKKKIGRDS